MSDKLLGFLPEHLRMPVMIGVPLLVLLGIVWVWNLSRVLGDPPLPPVLTEAEEARVMEQADLDYLASLDPAGLKAEIAQRQDAVAMAKHDGNEAAVVEKEMLLKRAKDLQANMGR